METAADIDSLERLDVAACREKYVALMSEATALGADPSNAGKGLQKFDHLVEAQRKKCATFACHTPRAACHTHTHMHMHMHMHMHIHSSIHTHTHMHAHTHVHSPCTTTVPLFSLPRVQPPPRARQSDGPSAPGPAAALAGAQSALSAQLSAQLSSPAAQPTPSAQPSAPGAMLLVGAPAQLLPAAASAAAPLVGAGTAADGNAQLAQALAGLTQVTQSALAAQQAQQAQQAQLVQQLQQMQQMQAFGLVQNHHVSQAFRQHGLNIPVDAAIANQARQLLQPPSGLQPLHVPPPLQLAPALQPPVAPLPQPLQQLATAMQPPLQSPQLALSQPAHQPVYSSPPAPPTPVLLGNTSAAPGQLPPAQ